ncbi:MAG: tat (twin-arginine translocation) pathway signal sequence [Spirochaetes bacterium GWF1_51_8]|nr:MAG: tat (twin-arginine translocation) pathway signal sequence [Spirochaetes bacterium GWF1_51_8]
MDRREFIRKSLAIGASAGLTLAGGGLVDLFAGDKKSKVPDLVAVKNGEPEAMFDAGIKALGGIAQFVKKGQVVLVKPNIGWDKSPEMAANTNPKLVKRIIEHCFNAGASKVYVFDHTCSSWQNSYKNSGIEQAAKDAGAEVVPASSPNLYDKVTIPGGVMLKEAKVHELLLSADVFINVPVLKHHSATQMTAAIKNLMGIVWDRGYFHNNDLHQCVADMAKFRKPTLNIVDAYRVLTANGPQSPNPADVALKKMLLISQDIVAIDTAAAAILEKNLKYIKYIEYAARDNLGQMDLEKLNIERISL